MHAILEKDPISGTILALHGPYYYESSIEKALQKLQKEGKTDLSVFQMTSTSSFLLTITHDLAAAGTALMRYSRSLQQSLEKGDLEAAKWTQKDLQASLEGHMGKVIQRLVTIADDEL